MSAHTSQADHAGMDWAIADPGDAGAIPVGLSGVCELVSATSETRTLARPSYLGQWLILSFKTDGGDIVVTCATTVNVTANTTMTFDTAGEMMLLLTARSGSDLVWRAMANQPEGDTPAVG